MKLLSLLDLYIVQVDGIVATIILYYFFGVLAGRIGSLVVGGILKACRVIRYTPREEYIKASQKDAEIKKALTIVLSFLVDKGSTCGYMLREKFC